MPLPYPTKGQKAIAWFARLGRSSFVFVSKLSIDNLMHIVNTYVLTKTVKKLQSQGYIVSTLVMT